MKLHQGLNGVSVGAVILALVAQPVWAAVIQVRAIQLKPTTNGIQLILKIQGNRRPPISTVNRTGTTTVDITDAQLQLPKSSEDASRQPSSFQRDNPAPGIRSVVVQQLNANSVRVTVQGTSNEPIEQAVRQDDTSLVLNFNQASATNTGKADPVATPTTSSPRNAPAEPQNVSQPSPSSLPTAPSVRDQPLAQSEKANPSTTPTAPNPRRAPAESLPQGSVQILPNTNEIRQILGSPVPPLLPSAVAPPVGDIAFASIDITPRTEDEGRVIMRTYRLNQIRATSAGGLARRFITKAETGGSVGGTFGFESSFGGQDQDVNTPISIETTASTGIGRTVSVSENIPSQGAKEILVAFGATGRGARAIGSSTGEDGATDETTAPEASGEGAANAGESNAAPLEGLEVVAESRTNTVTLIGSPRLVEIATALLKQFDVRRRQVAINVKIIDVDLSKGRNSNADLQYNASTSLGIGFGTDPDNSSRSGFFIGPVGTGAGLARLAENFLLNIFASIEDQSSKILTNPTLVVQEGSSAQVNLTQEIFSGFESTEVFTDTEGVSRSRRKPIIRPAGVIVNVTIDHIDDNGFVSLRLAPEVSAPSGDTFRDEGTEARLLLQRRLETGLVRLRDGQTLVLTGIIQEQDRISVSKVPILGDIPLLGRLFRREEKISERREVVVLVTPQILDDSDQSQFGYEYRPSPETQKLIKP